MEFIFLENYQLEKNFTRFIIKSYLIFKVNKYYY